MRKKKMKKKLLAESPYKTVSLLILLLFVLYYYKQKQSYAEKTIPNTTKVQEKAQKTNNNQIIKEKSAEPQPVNISITNNITKEMITYKHWSGSYAPSIFTITISGNQLSNNQTTTTKTTTQNTITIRYDYSFANGYKTGSREIEFIISPEKTQYALTFSWQHPTHLILENAAIKQATVVTFNKSLESKKS